MYIGRDEKKKKDTLTLSLGQIEQLNKTKQTRTRIKKKHFFFPQNTTLSKLCVREGEGERGRGREEEEEEEEEERGWGRKDINKT